MNALNNLQKRNNVLKLKLLHEKLKYGNYQFNTFRNELLLVLDAYKTHKSLIKAADSVSIDKKLVITWFIEGLSGNPQFRDFYLGIKRMNELKPQNSSPEAEEVVSSEVVDVVVPEVEEVVSSEVVDVVVPEAEEAVKNYTISEFLNACTYTAEIDGEKISIISRDLDTLKQIVKSKNLPID